MINHVQFPDIHRIGASCPCSLAWPQGIIDSDPQLAEHVEHLRYRYAHYQRTRDAIVGAEGSLADFAKVPNTLLQPSAG